MFGAENFPFGVETLDLKLGPLPSLVASVIELDRKQAFFSDGRTIGIFADDADV